MPIAFRSLSLALRMMSLASRCAKARLHVAARKAEDPKDRSYLHRGIATRAFERRFALADHVRVTGATHDLGMLHIDLVREMPEALKPRRIEIGRPSDLEAKAIDPKLVETTEV